MTITAFPEQMRTARQLNEGSFFRGLRPFGPNRFILNEKDNRGKAIEVVEVASDGTTTVVSSIVDYTTVSGVAMNSCEFAGHLEGDYALCVGNNGGNTYAWIADCSGPAMTFGTPVVMGLSNDLFYPQENHPHQKLSNGRWSLVFSRWDSGELRERSFTVTGTAIADVQSQAFALWDGAVPANFRGHLYPADGDFTWLLEIGDSKVHRVSRLNRSTMTLDAGPLNLGDAATSFNDNVVFSAHGIYVFPTYWDGFAHRPAVVTSLDAWDGSFLDIGAGGVSFMGVHAGAEGAILGWNETSGMGFDEVIGGKRKGDAVFVGEEPSSEIVEGVAWSGNAGMVILSGLNDGAVYTAWHIPPQTVLNARSRSNYVRFA